VSLPDFVESYFANSLVFTTIFTVCAVAATLLVIFSLGRSSPRLRVGVLFTLFSTVVFGWGFVSVSLVFCIQLLGLYATTGERAVQVVLGLALFTSLIAALPFSVFVTLSVPRAMIRRLEKDSASAEEVSSFSLERIIETMGLTGIALLRSPSDSPLAYSIGGRRRAALVISDGLERLLDKEEMQAVITHELAHIKNDDTRAKILISAYRRVLFFDPVLRLVERLYAKEKELLADEVAMRFTGKPNYLASALLKISFSAKSVACDLTSSISEGDDRMKPSVRERINRLLKQTQKTQLEPALPEARQG
jgi:Zn-dependent protease with chaperone function